MPFFLKPLVLKIIFHGIMGFYQTCSHFSIDIIFLTTESVFSFSRKKNVLLKFSHNILDRAFIVDVSAMKNTAFVLYFDLFL